MAFEKVRKQESLSTLKRRYRKLQEKYESLRYQFKEHINLEDFEVLNVEDFLELKTIYIEKKQLYWEIYRIENPNDTATEKAYRFLNSMSKNEQVDFLMKHHLTTHRLIDAIKENPNFLNEVTA